MGNIPRNHKNSIINHSAGRTIQPSGNLKINVFIMKKKVLFSAAVLLAASSAFAQGNGMAGISEATNMVTSYFDPLTKLIFAVAAILGLVGGVRVYSKFSSGDPDASKSATALFLSCVFLVIVGTVLRSFFL